MLVNLFTEVLNMGLTIIPIVLIILIARWALSQIAPRVFSYALWAVLLFRLLCPITIEAPFSAINEDVTSGKLLEEYTSTYIEDVVYYDDTTDEYAAAVDAGMEPVIHFDHDTKSYGSYVVTSKDEIAPAASVKNTVIPILSYVWIGGILVLVVYSFISFLLLKKKLVGAVPLKENIYLADHIDSPFVLGILGAKIYLPSSLTEHERKYIILHEKHHIKRGDHIVKFLAFAALCIHWMNPLVWLSFILAMKDMEMSCDEAVIKRMGEEIREEYSASLLSLATGKPIISMTPLAFGEGDTKSRIKNVLAWKRPVLLGSIMAALVCLFVAIYCVPNMATNSPDQSLAELTSTLQEEDITELVCSIYEDGNDVKSTWLSIGAYPGLKKEFISVMNSLKEDDFVLADNYLNEYNVVLNYRTQHDDGYELLLKYHNGVTSFTTEYLNEYSAGTNEEWQTTNVDLANYMEKLIEISMSDEPHIRDAHIAFSETYVTGKTILHTYYEMSDGTFRTDDYEYKYRYSRTGKISDSAAAYNTYIILSNEKNITFEQAWKAAGLSSDTEDYFDPAESVIVAVIDDKIDVKDRTYATSGTFENILGLDGLYKITSIDGDYDYKYYYANINGALPLIAETFGSIEECYSVDVDGDGIEEFICNVTYGDGLRQTMIYHRKYNQIYRGFCDDLFDGPVDYLSSYTTEYSYYVPDEDIVRIHYYSRELDDYKVKDYQIDLDKIAFTLYEDLEEWL